MPDKNKIEILMKSMEDYRKIFIIKEENKEIKKIHTWKNPYPEMFFKKNESKNIINENNNIINENNKNKNNKMQTIKDNLTCFMLKINYIDDPEILLGYPIIKKGINKDEYELYPIPELISYEGFMSQIEKYNEKLDYYFQTYFKSANNEYYNYWFPIYINKNHYEKNRTTILNSLSIIKYGHKGIKEYDFQIEQIFEILPQILNKMIINIISDKTSISSAFVICLFHIVLLFRKLCEEFEEQYIKYLNHKLNTIHRNNYNINKLIIPDLGDFFILLYFCNRNIHKEQMKKIWNALFEEYLTRQMYSILEDLDYLPEIFGDLSLKKPEYIKNNIELIKDDIMTKILQKSILFKEIRTNEDYYCSGIENYFINELKQNGKYNKLLELISSNKNKGQEFVIKKFKQYNKKTINKHYKLYNPNNIYILDFLLKCIFEYNKENKLLLIIFLIYKKINEKGFIEELENNFGIFMEPDNFIKLMKQKMDEIRCYKELFEYIGSDIGKNDEIEIFLKGYNKIKKNGYLKQINI